MACACQPILFEEHRRISILQNLPIARLCMIGSATYSITRPPDDTKVLHRYRTGRRYRVAYVQYAQRPGKALPVSRGRWIIDAGSVQREPRTGGDVWRLAIVSLQRPWTTFQALTKRSGEPLRHISSNKTHLVSLVFNLCVTTATAFHKTRAGLP